MNVLFQLRSFLRLAWLIVAWLVTAPFIAFVYVIYSVVEWLSTPFASQVPKRGDVVLITGASTGIGLSAATCLQERGFCVFAGVRNQEDYDRLQRLGLKPIMLDVGKNHDISEALQTVQRELTQTAEDGRRFAALINNAGICIPGPFQEQSGDLDMEMFSTNVLGAMSMTRAFLPILRLHHSRVVFVGSVSGYMPQPAVATYTATKFAIRGLALSLAEELEPMGISLSIVEPAQTSTPIFDKAQHALGGSEDYAGLVNMVDFYNKVLVRLIAAKPESSTDYAIVKAVTAYRPLLQYRSSWMATMHHYLSWFPPQISACNVVVLAYRAAYGMSAGWKCA